MRSVVLFALVGVATILGVAAATAAVPQKLVGRWDRNITVPDAIGADHMGMWSLVFRKNGRLTIYEPVGAHVEGVRDTIVTTFSATARGRLVVGAAAACSTKGIYRWKLVEGLLVISKVSDACSTRVAVTVGTWSR